jgi:DNA-binding beta-propeller fold protein YncE
MRLTFRSLTLALMGVSAAGCASDAGSVELASQAQAVQRLDVPEQRFTAFETLQTRPLALSPDGQLLFAANTPDNRVEVFKIKPGSRHKKPVLEAVASVPVGLEPIAIAARSDSELWVANHLSDSISIVTKGQGGAWKVTRTLHVGDEPRDIVFAGPGKSRAFVTTAHRGQNSPDDPDLFPPEFGPQNPPTQPLPRMAGRADVWVFDANNLGSAAGGTRLTKLTMFADTPRALAVSGDGATVYAAPFFSGNQTTIASVDAVRHVYASQMHPSGHPNLFMFEGVPHPITGRVVKFKAGPNGMSWYDDLGTDFSPAALGAVGAAKAVSLGHAPGSAEFTKIVQEHAALGVRISLPDHDVFTIDATANPPAVVESATFNHVGTTLFNMAVNPVNGKVYVANTEAHNDIRFEGHGTAEHPSTVRSTAVDSRITVLTPGDTEPFVVDLNGHVVDGIGEKSLSRAFPQDLAVTADGKKLFVVLQGSQKLGIYDTALLEAGDALPSAQNQVALSAGGPAGVVINECNKLAFVLTRFDNGISIIDLSKETPVEVKHTTMFNPEPTSVTEGRRFLYDATFTSDNGTQACASCHVGGDLDALSWDLGNPSGSSLPTSTAYANELDMWTAPPSGIIAALPPTAYLFAKMDNVKGPMGTQSLRGLANHGSMHWRGDRNGAIKQDGTPFIDPATGQPQLTAQPDSGMMDEFEAFNSFNVAFVGLLGRSAQLTDAEMAAFTTFALELTYPPNPIRKLDNSLTAEQETGRAFYFQTNADGTEKPVDRLHNCNGCHVLDRAGNAGLSDQPGFFGSDGKMSFENLPQAFKVAHLRNAYQKLGMFASAPDENRAITPIPTLNPARVAVRGFGYQPDGAVGSIMHHLSGRGFIQSPVEIGGIANLGGIPTFTFSPTGQVTGIDPAGIVLRRAIASFVLAYDSNLFPIVGQQITLTKNAGADVGARIDLLEARAALGECDVVVKGRYGNDERAFVLANGQYVADRAGAPRTSAWLRGKVTNPNDTLTFTCVPPGSGYRIGIDRDSDGYADRDEQNAGSNPADAASVPCD